MSDALPLLLTAQAEAMPLADGSVDLIVTSPPYDDIREYGGFSLDLEAVGLETLRVLRPGGVAVVVIRDSTAGGCSGTSFRLAVDWMDAGLNLWADLIYRRDGRPGPWWKSRFRVDHEYIFVFVKGKKPNRFDKQHLAVPAKHAGKTWTGTQRLTDGTLQRRTGVVAAMKCGGSVLHYATSNSEGDRLKAEHPATFPDALASDMIRCFSVAGDVVLDPFSGSGTTPIAAQRLGRRGVGLDINPTYVSLAARRAAA